MFLLDILNRVNHKTQQYLNVPVLNTNTVSCSIGKNMPLVFMHPVGTCKEVQEVSWNNLQCKTSKLLLQIPHHTRLQLEPDSKGLSRSVPDVDFPEEARINCRDLLERKYLNIISQNVMDIGKTNLIELNILMEGQPIASRPYTVPLKCSKFIDHKIKQLEEAGIISQSMSNWASPILVVPKKQDCMDSHNAQGSSNFNLWLCISHRNLNCHIQTACQIKANGTLACCSCINQQ